MANESDEFLCRLAASDPLLSALGCATGGWIRDDGILAFFGVECDGQTFVVRTQLHSQASTSRIYFACAEAIAEAKRMMAAAATGVHFERVCDDWADEMSMAQRMLDEALDMADDARDTYLEDDDDIDDLGIDEFNDEDSGNIEKF
jgi:hypothetical protein